MGSLLEPFEILYSLLPFVPIPKNKVTQTVTPKNPIIIFKGLNINIYFDKFSQREKQQLILEIAKYAFQQQ